MLLVVKPNGTAKDRHRPKIWNALMDVPVGGRLQAAESWGRPDGPVKGVCDAERKPAGQQPGSGQDLPGPVGPLDDWSPA